MSTSSFYIEISHKHSVWLNTRPIHFYYYFYCNYHVLLLLLIFGVWGELWWAPTTGFALSIQWMVYSLAIFISVCIYLCVYVCVCVFLWVCLCVCWRKGWGGIGLICCGSSSFSEKMGLELRRIVVYIIWFEGFL